MNANDRTFLKALTARLEKTASYLVSIQAEIETLRNAEQDKFDEMSEGLQQGETGQNIEAAQEALDEAYDSLDMATESVGDAVSRLGDV